ncbi:cation-dependent mannose-6-phosphate receptor [Chanos chanos]|uniref:Cation-dependent mannose-6-phosphate receptor n=1 Tax=Chanos chanos TaxID=29144 RepID=A0A6J2W875_CHACN|nr:cation-dependent mannose-6-phosphate receptor [Chanos chanos]
MFLFKTMPLVSTILILIILLAGGGQGDDKTDCRLVKESESERKVLKLLEPLKNRDFNLTVKTDKDDYTYVFRVCGAAVGVDGAGLVQINNKNEKKTRIGNYTNAQAIGGSDWVMLIYTGGTEYESHCNKESRKAIIMISCDRRTSAGDLSLVLEDRERESDCFYLFELDSSAVCPVLQSKLSTGSILLIICFSSLAVYLIVGFLYLRLVVGAKGVDQFPNYTFWTEIGNLAADGCDFVCRSRGSREEPPTYRGVSTEPLGEEPEERDDHLLPM